MSHPKSRRVGWVACGAALTLSTTAAAQAPATDGWTDPAPPPAAPPTAAEGDAAPIDPPPSASLRPAVATAPVTAPATTATPAPAAAETPVPTPAAEAPTSDTAPAAGAPAPVALPRPHAADRWGDQFPQFEHNHVAASPNNTFGFGMLGMGIDASPDQDGEPTTRFIVGGFMGRLRASAFLGSSYNDDSDEAHLQYGLTLGVTNGASFRMSPSMQIIYDPDRNSTGIFGFLPLEWVGDQIVGGVHLGFGRWSGKGGHYYYSEGLGDGSSVSRRAARKSYGSEAAFTLMGVVGARFGEDVAPLAERRESTPEKEMFVDWVLAPVTIMDGAVVAAMSGGLQVGGFIGPVRLAAQAMLPLYTEHENLSVMDSLVFGGSAGFALRSTNFAFSPGVKVLHFGGATPYSETEPFLTFPFEWTLSRGYRLGFSYDTFSVTQKAINVQLQFGTAL